MGQVLGLYSNGEFCLQCSTSMSVEMDKSSAAQLPGTWGIPRSVKLHRVAGQSLGISIVGKMRNPLYGGLIAF